ncbi:phasin [Aureimonas fodinaquatilis]|uniref:Phasin n=2 Tax=Aureimonas fodinaquatilis TaxID=2565783 RepID=A0A5B0E1X2_9HYPH|nr:phasin [Aureimonas fodinaquatilis]
MEDTFKEVLEPESIARAQAAMGLDPEKFQEMVSNLAERAVAQSRQAYQVLKANSDEATRAVESTLENVHSGSLSLSKQAIEALRTNADLGFAHLEKLGRVKSVAELVELQTSYFRQQTELLNGQLQNLQSLSRTVAQEVVRPGKEAVERAGKPK